VGPIGPRVWLAPQPPTGGHIDVEDFVRRVPWPRVEGRIQVLEADWPWIAGGPDEAVGDRLASELDPRGIRFAFQAESLTQSDRCGRGVRGFAGRSTGRRIVASLAEEGARPISPEMIVLDAPFAFGHLYRGPGACRWSVRKVAEAVAAYRHDILGRVLAHVARVRQPFSGLEIGDAEPLWPGVRPEQMERWISAYREASGSGFSFFHLDVDFARPDWSEAARTLETFCRNRGIPFGIVYSGQGSSDRAFADSATNRSVTYETEAGGHPEDVVFRSRQGSAGAAFDQSQADVMAGLVGRYLRPRTTLEMEVAPSVHAGSFRAVGTLSVRGRPVANAGVHVTLAPADGPGSYDTYSLGGVVPAGATAARVGFDIDTACACAGSTDFALYGASYQDGGRPPNRVPNADFSQGLASWRLTGGHVERVVPTDRGDGSMLSVMAGRNREAAATSGPFPARPGTRFTVSFAARVAPISVGSGAFVVVFLRSGAEIRRDTIPLAPVSYDLGTATTDTDGSFHLTFHPPGAGAFVVHASYAGSDRLWPACQVEPIFS
jgi:hypothetical protein